jgi:hypothetical protein
MYFEEISAEEFFGISSEWGSSAMRFCDFFYIIFKFKIFQI